MNYAQRWIEQVEDQEDAADNFLVAQIEMAEDEIHQGKHDELLLELFIAAKDNETKSMIIADCAEQIANERVQELCTL